jgi:hypothetical protein
VTAWLEEWTRPLPWERDEESLIWLRSRPECVKKLILRFPPSCVVKGTIPMHCPAPGGHGIICSYFEPSATCKDGSVTVRPGPDAEMRYECRPENLVVVGYWRGLTPEVVAVLMGGG